MKKPILFLISLIVLLVIDLSIAQYKYPPAQLTRTVTVCFKIELAGCELKECREYPVGSTYDDISLDCERWAFSQFRMFSSWKFQDDLSSN